MSLGMDIHSFLSCVFILTSDIDQAKFLLSLSPLLQYN